MGVVSLVECMTDAHTCIQYYSTGYMYGSLHTFKTGYVMSDTYCTFCFPQSREKREVNPVKSSHETLNLVFAKTKLHSSPRQAAGCFASNGVKILHGNFFPDQLNCVEESTSKLSRLFCIKWFAGITIYSKERIFSKQWGAS